MIEIKIRECDPSGDEAFILACWARQTRPLPPFSGMPKDDFDRHIAAVRRCVSAPGSCIVACAPDSDSQIFGFICGDYSWPILHMAYVRNTWRRMGIASKLFTDFFGFVPGAFTLSYTHPARAVRHLTDRWRLIHNPYLFQVTQ